MYLSVKTAKGKKYFSFMESYRDDGKVKKRVVLSLGNYNNALSIVKTDYPEFISDIEKHADLVEVVPTNGKVVPTPKIVVPTNLMFSDMSVYQSGFDLKVVAAHKDYTQRGTRIILQRIDNTYLMAFLYDGVDCEPYLFEGRQNCAKRHWVIDRWSWDSEQSYVDFMIWYADLLD